MNIQGYIFTVGADPEVFVENSKGQVVSAHGMVPGTKAKPFRVSERGFVQVDGMALEYNVEPCESQAEFRANIFDVQNRLSELVPKGYSLSKKIVADFTPKYIDSQPTEAKILGCEPDFNAYTGEQNPTPDAKVSFRTAAGHIHVGWTKNVNPMDHNHFKACMDLAKHLDSKVGLMCMVLEDDGRRRELYGKAGAFRPKPYGMEYRVPSNVWTHLASTQHAVFRTTTNAILNTFYDGQREAQGRTKRIEELGPNIRDAINNANFDDPLTKRRAFELVYHHNVSVKRLNKHFQERGGF